ncbi:hypothetical protein JQ596_20030 [Bradyrhizobium manausense]|uniref:hypothetical protein n=1 Tax=Bradyrhizobium TaxID=374 RepID=UPI001BAC267D|nr:MULTISPECIES: hypothetical protein [Bradyrhizobium]MBR0827824.1 hypothetical protein [Bradyrhizobium manausense]UVO26292.1 hypothetical protein KUF59_27490 [Bradyrhizobium arachidis]
MRSEPLLATEPPAPVRNIGELFAIAITQTRRAAQHYRKLAVAGDKAFEPVRCVFEVLSEREQERAQAIEESCIAAIGRAPTPADLRWMPMDLVPAEELSDLENSLLSTAYGAWALAVRHRERAFIFWTYVAALAETGSVRTAAEGMAREALRDGNLLRRERRLAWRAERREAVAGDTPAANELSSAALLESLLLRDIYRWSQEAPAPQRRHLLSLIGDGSQGPMPGANDALPHAEALDEIKRRALRHAEQLSSIYLDEADRAVDQSRLELAQQLAARSIARLADLRTIASQAE